jgi:hypothetical protein
VQLIVRLQSKRAARIEQLLKQRGIYECQVPAPPSPSSTLEE